MLRKDDYNINSQVKKASTFISLLGSWKLMYTTQDGEISIKNEQGK